MADATRFPKLALPFAIVGASAGWLSVGMVANPLWGFVGSISLDKIARITRLTAGIAAVLALLTGMIIRRLCVGKRYAYGIEDINPDLRPFTDVWALHVGVVIVAGVRLRGSWQRLRQRAEHATSSPRPTCAARTMREVRRSFG